VPFGIAKPILAQQNIHLIFDDYENFYATGWKMSTSYWLLAGKPYQSRKAGNPSGNQGRREEIFFLLVSHGTQTGNTVFNRRMGTEEVEQAATG
jgi:hypothetical protein